MCIVGGSLLKQFGNEGTASETFNSHLQDLYNKDLINLTCVQGSIFDRLSLLFYILA